MLFDDKQEQQEDFEDSALNNLDLNENHDREGRQSDDIFEDSELEPQIKTFVDQGEDVQYADKPQVEGYSGDPAFEDNEEYIQKHFSATLAEIAKHRDYFDPAYQFGFEVAVSDEFPDNKVIDVEDDMREIWETTNPDTWERFKPAILYGWKIGYMQTHDVELNDPMMEAAARGEVQETSTQ